MSPVMGGGGNAVGVGLKFELFGSKGMCLVQDIAAGRCDELVASLCAPRVYLLVRWVSPACFTREW